MRLLFITQKIHQNDDDLAFVILWVKEFIRQGFDVQVICLEKGDFDDSFPVFSLGKERGKGKFSRILKFIKLIISLKYDRVFIHMNPEYGILGGWWWILGRTPVYLWYTHYTMHFHLWFTCLLSKRMFAATKQSLPQYDSSKKIVTGHGIDIDYWLSGKNSLQVVEEISEYKLISVHRLSRSKRLDIVIRALKLLPRDYTLSVYGRAIDIEYYKELKKLIEEQNLQDRVSFYGPVPMGELKQIYPKFSLMVNMASETIDKTMLEGMLFGLYPVTTRGNTTAIGLGVYPNDDTPESVAKFILSKNWMKYSKQDLLSIVKVKHSLPVLIRKMGNYIKDGK